MSNFDAEFNMLVITLGGLTKDFPIVRKFEYKKKKSSAAQTYEKHIEVRPLIVCQISLIIQLQMWNTCTIIQTQYATQKIKV